jgi:hypothetical protein
VFSLLAAWTDVAVPDPFVVVAAGRSKRAEQASQTRGESPYNQDVATWVLTVPDLEAPRIAISLTHPAERPGQRL